VAGHFLSRQERFAVVGSTNDVVRAWLAEGTREVALAIADEQAQGRGREGRTWTAPKGKALLLSLGFRPSWLLPDQAWRLAATASLAMAEAAEATADLPNGTIRLKWPNDLVLDAPDRWLKLGGVLGETEGLGTADPRVIVGMGVNGDWPLAEFPADIADGMTSLREASGGHRTAPDDLLNAFLPSLEAGIEALRAGRFEAGEWQARQATTGRSVRLELPNGQAEDVLATGVDPDTGALLLDDGRRVLSAEIRHLRPVKLAAKV
jgi:BirA family biotin operon repressor/biotin-[acetyl-CoA-carboxylase] ligase